MIFEAIRIIREIRVEKNARKQVSTHMKHTH